MTGTKTRAVFLKAFPKAAPTPDLFEIRSIETPDPAPGEALLRTVWMSVDPYMRGRMRPEVKSYIPPFSLDEPLSGGAVSEVVSVNGEGLSPGDYVVGFSGGWRDYHTASISELTKVDPSLAPLSAYLGVLGMPGFTGWHGLMEYGRPKA
ncbi:MAG: NADP-dependent oxidoreductase, partial [Pseudomonadota bacterium]